MATRHGTFKGAEDLYRRKFNNGDFKPMVQTTLLAQDQKDSVSLFGTEHEGSHSNYMNAKVAKLRQVQDKRIEFLNENNNCENMSRKYLKSCLGWIPRNVTMMNTVSLTVLFVVILTKVRNRPA